MDGNRRWAMNKNTSSINGHKEGAKTLKRIVKHCSKLKVEELTVFAFSTENWLRPKSEVETLINLISWYLKSEIGDLDRNNVVFSVVGQREGLPTQICDLIDRAEKITKKNTGLKFNVALNYGGKIDILYAVKNIILNIEKGIIQKEDINNEIIKNNLLSKNISEIDLLIRTSGETRISNFLLWQLSYSEMYFSDILWPDFNENELEKAIAFYSLRDRRFGMSFENKSGAIS